jgi:hypothetical protein
MTSGTSSTGYTQGQGNSGYGWHRNSPVGRGYAPSGTPTNGTTTAGNTQGWQGNYGHNGQAGAYQQPGAQPWTRPGQPATWQGQQYQQARMQAPQTQMRPNLNMRPQQPSMFGGMVNRASFSALGGIFRRR